MTHDSCFGDHSRPFPTFQPYFGKEGITLHLVYTNGYSDSMKAMHRSDSKVTAAFSFAGITPKGSFPDIETLSSIEYVPL